MIKIDRTKISLAVICIAIALLAVTAVIAESWITNDTPLYTFRMEQTSNKMNFLPTSVNEFIYTTEKGYTLNYDNMDCRNGGNSLGILADTRCDFTCKHSCGSTCPWINTCHVTACFTYTCSACDTLWVTCVSCEPTCDGYTC